MTTAIAGSHHSDRLSALNRMLLSGGVLAAATYIALDLTAAAQYPGYSIRDQAISELSAVGAPTAGLWGMVGPIFGVCLLAFAVGAWRAGRNNRPLRLTGVLILLLGATGVAWPFFPMHQRGAETSWMDVGHLALGAICVAIIAAFVAVGSRAAGGRFRLFSQVTLVAVIVTGPSSFVFVNRIARNEPTPWLGAIERVTIYGYLLWIAVLAIALLAPSRAASSRARAP